MKEVRVGRTGQVALVDDEDYERVSKYTWRINRKPRYHTPYVHAHIPGPHPRKDIKLHRLVLDAQPLQIVDHINGNGLDCRRVNLRIVTTTQNAQHSEKGRRACGTHSSKYKGVHWLTSHSRWEACIRVNGERKRLGLFMCELAAATAYDKAALEYFGEYALLNRPVEAAR